MCVRVSFLVKFQTDVCNFIKKETPAEVLYEFCEIFKNTIFLEHLQAISSDNQTNNCGEPGGAFFLYLPKPDSSLLSRRGAVFSGILIKL